MLNEKVELVSMNLTFIIILITIIIIGFHASKVSSNPNKNFFNDNLFKSLGVTINEIPCAC